MRIRIGTCAIAVAGVLALGSCGGERARASGSLEVSDSAGVEMVHNPRVGLLGERADLEEVRRIGRIEGEAPYLLSRVYDLAVGADGTYFVGNSQTATVRVYTPDGEYVREFGGRGKGPGEFVMVNRVEMVGDDVAVIDWQVGGTLGLFSRDGDLLEYHALTAPDGTMQMVQGRGPQGWIGGVSRPGDYRRDHEPGQAYPRDIDIRVLHPGTDSIGPVVFDLAPAVSWGSAVVGTDWSLFRGGSPPILDSSGRLYRADGETYRIEMYDSDGSLVRVISREYDPVPVGEADVDALIALMNARYDTMSTGTSASRERSRANAIARIREQATFPHPSTMPPLGSLLAADDGSFWVARLDMLRPAEVEYRHYVGDFFTEGVDVPAIWDVFDPKGRFLAAVDMPPRFSPMAVTSRTVTGVLKDSLDVEYVVTYRVRGRER